MSLAMGMEHTAEYRLYPSLCIKLYIDHLWKWIIEGSEEEGRRIVFQSTFSFNISSGFASESLLHLWEKFLVPESNKGIKIIR